MPSTFDELEAKGFKFVTVSELLGMATPVTPHPKAEPAEKTPAKAAPSVSELLGRATLVTPHPKMEPAEKTATKATPSAVPTSSPGG
jgi:hypothetical protein